jgi:hypothetical protein
VKKWSEIDTNIKLRRSIKFLDKFDKISGCVLNETVSQGFIDNQEISVNQQFTNGKKFFSVFYK